MERSFATKAPTSINGPFRPPAPERRPPPHIAAMNEAIRYFQEKYGKDNQQQKVSLCKDAFSCQPWAVEPELMQDLVEARLIENPQEKDNKIQRIRKSLRAVSWQEHLQASTDQLVKTINHIKQGLAHEAHMARRIQDQEAEGWEEQMKETDVILQALESGAKGNDANPAAQAIEDVLWNSYKEYRSVIRQLTEAFEQGLEPDALRIQQLKGLRAQIVDKILGLRVVRDQIYFQALYDGWYISSPTKKAV